MAYHGYLPIISKYAANVRKEKGSVKILEIGLLSGVSLFSIVSNMNILGVDNYEYTGVDIKLQEEIKIFNYYTLKHANCKINLIEEDSLKFLKNCKESFDIILIDGDHNYPTVKKECEYLPQLSHKNTLFVFDDYYGKWSTKDLYYSDLDDWKNIDNFSKLEKDDQKKGVKPAVDEFIKNNNLKSFTLMKGEPICLIYQDNELLIV